MKTLLKVLFCAIFVFNVKISAQLIYSDTTGILIETTLDWWLVEDHPAGVLKMNEAGVDVVRSLELDPARVSLLKNTYHLNVIPMRVSGQNWIQHYTDAKYSVWEAEGVPSEISKVNLLYDTLALTKISESDTLKYMKLIPDYAGSVRTLIKGPYYNQDVYYYTAQDDSADKKILYTASYKLKLEHNPLINPLPPDNFSDTICVLQVTQSTVSGDWSLPCTFVIDSLIVKRSDFNSLGNFKQFDIEYNLLRDDCNNTLLNEPEMPYSFSSDRFGEPHDARVSRDYIEFKVIWKGNPNYLISIDKVTLSDQRGRDLVGDINGTGPKYDIKTQANSLNDYNNVVEGWLGVDEPLSLDIFEPIRIVKELLETSIDHPRPLYLTFMGHWNSTWNQPENPFGSYGESPWEEFGKRVGNTNIIQDFYLYDYPCDENSTYDICQGDWRSSNIYRMAELNYKQAYQLDNNFGISIQCGKINNTQATEREVEPYEILYNANLALMYGAKFLSLYRYFPVSDINDCGSGSTCTGIVNISGDTLEYTNKYFMLRDTLSPRLKGLFGKTLKTLTPTEQSLGVYCSLDNNIGFIKSILLYEDSPPPSGPIFEIGIFNDPQAFQKKYCMLLKRYYPDSTHNTFTVGFKELSGYYNWKYIDYRDTTTYTLRSNSNAEATSDTVHIERGDAAFISLHPVVLYGGSLAYNDTIKTNATLIDNMTINNAIKLFIKAGYFYTIQDTVTLSGAGQTPNWGFIIGDGYLDVASGGEVLIYNWANSLFKGKSNSHPKLFWGKYTDPTVNGYNIYRKKETPGYVLIGSVSGNVRTFIDTTVTIIEGSDQSSVEAEYLVKAKYIYRGHTVESSPSNSIMYKRVEGSSLEKQNTGLTGEDFTYALEQNYPNPFNPNTTINYSIAQDGLVEIEIVDIIGRRVTSLVNEFQTKGTHYKTFNASHLSSGIYLYRIKSGEFIQTRKMLLLK